MSHHTTTPGLHAYDQQVCATIWTSPHARELMETISYHIGPRPTGSKGMREAARLLMGVFRKMDASNVHTEPVLVLAWREGPSRVELKSPRSRVYESLHHVHTAGGKLTAAVVDGESGSEDVLDRLAKKINGAIVLLRGHEVSGAKFVPIQIRVKRVLDRGAAAILMQRVETGGLPAIELIGIEEDFPIPVVGISHEDGAELAEFARAGRTRVRLEASGKSYKTDCVNTIAELGPPRAQEVVILSAHLDSYWLSPGSFDNLSGVVTLMTVADALAPLQGKFRRRLRLIVYTGEEYAFLGSKAYIARHGKELDEIRFVLNMDSLWPATAEGMAVMWAPAMRDYIDAAFRQTERKVDVRNLFCMSSDYLPFMLEGIAAARPAGFEAAFPPWSHTILDTADKMASDALRQNAMAYGQLLLRILMDPEPLPTKRRTPEETKALVAKEDVADVLRPFGFDV